MFKLNGEDAKQAWEDYKSFLEGMGGDLSQGSNPSRNHWVAEVERAFKFAFAAGKASKGEIVTDLNERPKMGKIITGEARKVETVEIVNQKGRTIKRRTEAEQAQDARLVASIMQRNGGPMPLHEIIKAVNAAGGDWYDRSASGHMNKVMERIPAIKKVGYGVFEYQQ
jgi:hypothetical protein